MSQQIPDAAVKAALAEIQAGNIETQLAASILPYIEAISTLERQNREYEKQLTRLVKRLPVYPWVKSDKGKESYKQHVANRAHRYTEKRLLKHIYIEWRRAI